MKPIRVLVADDHAMVRTGITTMLEAFSDFQLVGEAANGEEVIRLCNLMQPDVILMDIVMPLTDGITAMQTIIAAHPGVRIIVLTSFEDAVMVKAAIAAGASGYLLKNVSAHDLAAAIRTTMNGLPAMSPEATQVLMNASKQAPPQAAAYGLTERELDVLRLVVRGLSNNEIAARLEVSPFTIKNHVSSILSKLNVMSRTEAATLALQQRLVQLDS
jgi:NarL family two-component system response regulator LiaR